MWFRSGRALHFFKISSGSNGATANVKGGGGMAPLAEGFVKRNNRMERHQNSLSFKSGLTPDLNQRFFCVVVVVTIGATRDH